MSGSGQFCPRCGSPIEGRGFSPPDRRGAAEARLCSECYADAIELLSVPDQVEVTICTQCGAIKEDGEWREADERDYTDVAIDALADRIGIHRDASDVSWTVDPHQRGPNELDLQVTVTAIVGDRPIVEEASVSAHIARETCSRCGRMAGDYFAGTVQIRAADRPPTGEETDRAVAIAHQIAEAGDDRAAFVSEVIEQPDGTDIRVSKNNLARRIARRIRAELGGTVESSETLVTEDAEGEGVYRVAFAVRLPKFRPGDVIELDDGRPILVLGDVRGRGLAGGEDVTIEEADVERAKHIGSIGDVTETTLVTVEDDRAIQVLDPETAASVTIPRPADLSVDQDTVPVLKTSLGLHAIPKAIVQELQA